MMSVCLIWTLLEQIVCYDKAVVYDATTRIIGRNTEYCLNHLLRDVDTIYNIIKDISRSIDKILLIY